MCSLWSLVSLPRYGDSATGSSIIGRRISFEKTYVHGVASGDRSHLRFNRCIIYDNLSAFGAIVTVVLVQSQQHIPRVPVLIFQSNPNAARLRHLREAAWSDALDQRLFAFNRVWHPRLRREARDA